MKKNHQDAHSNGVRAPIPDPRDVEYGCICCFGCALLPITIIVILFFILG